ncbi:lactate utilization protein [Candidatus Formimonas warabiya]|uniref:Lactate utilization protein C n=1 Tax=Formimonas warabiya TaxID=1761012 RepID=A0A3G1L1M0_FORW1|nr:lactate utilization protein [Candidatus Formimonas warabiya]ATW28692.1 lactate utilization protein C [Candidatus Formimonas warabiya]
MSIDQWHHDRLGEKVVQALRKNEFDAVYFPHRQEAIEQVLTYISPGDAVGIGGSATLNELGIPEKAAALGAKILNHNLPGLSPEAKMDIRRRQLLSDVFLCSTNAVTLEGYLVNVDGVGNRVGAMTFGPKKVVIVAGINKVCTDEKAAFERISMIASPKNNKRLETSNPCLTTGVCCDCQGKTRICRIYAVMKKRPMVSDITVVLVGENLGY